MVYRNCFMLFPFTPGCLSWLLIVDYWGTFAKTQNSAWQRICTHLVSANIFTWSIFWFGGWPGTRVGWEFHSPHLCLSHTLTFHMHTHIFRGTKANTHKHLHALACTLSHIHFHVDTQTSTYHTNTWPHILSQSILSHIHTYTCSLILSHIILLPIHRYALVRPHKHGFVHTPSHLNTFMHTVS